MEGRMIRTVDQYRLETPANNNYFDGDYLVVCDRFASLSDLMDHIDTHQPDWWCSSSGRCKDHYDQFAQLARNGCPDFKKLQLASVDFRRRIRAVDGKRLMAEVGVAGHALHISNYLSGQPESMQHWGRIAHPDRVIRIAVPATLYKHTPERYYTNRGVAILALIDALEMAGFSVAVDLFAIDLNWPAPKISLSGDKGGSWYRAAEMMTFTLKQAQERSDPDKFALCLANDLTWKGLFWGSRYSAPPIDIYVNYSPKPVTCGIASGQQINLADASLGTYGASLPKALRSEYHIVLEELRPGYSSDFDSIQSSGEWLKRQLANAKINIQFEEVA